MRSIQSIEQQHNRGSNVAGIIASAMTRPGAERSPIPAFDRGLGQRFNALLRGGLKMPFERKRRTKSSTGMMTVAEVADQLGVEPPAVLGLIHARRLPAADISSSPGRATWRITPESLKAFLEGGQPAPPTPKTRKRRPEVGRVTAYF